MKKKSVKKKSISRNEALCHDYKSEVDKKYSSLHNKHKIKLRNEDGNEKLRKNGKKKVEWRHGDEFLEDPLDRSKNLHYFDGLNLLDVFPGKMGGSYEFDV